MTQVPRTLVPMQWSVLPLPFHIWLTGFMPDRMQTVPPFGGMFKSISGKSVVSQLSFKPLKYQATASSLRHFALQGAVHQ